MYLLVWLTFALMSVLIFMADSWVEKLDDENSFKKWWKKHISDWGPNGNKSI